MAKILVVDDNQSLVNMYLEIFKDNGYEVDVAFDGEEALKKVPDFKPDLILLDIIMPNINGLATLSKLKENKETEKIPVILLTNVGWSNEDIKRGLELGAVSYLIKSNYTPEEVVQRVKEILAA